MRTKRIIPIVEGYGEERAVPILLRRWLQFRDFHRHFEVPDRAINAKGSGRLKAGLDYQRHVGIEHYIRAALRNGPDAILVLLDADDECARRATGPKLGPEILARAREVAATVPVAVVVANREFEAWFLAALQSLRARGLVPPRGNLLDPVDPEAVRDCKGRIGDFMGCGYEETMHQYALTQGLGFSQSMGIRSPSYAKLLRDLERLTRDARRRTSR